MTSGPGAIKPEPPLADTAPRPFLPNMAHLAVARAVD
jgi:hypothetical protein